MTGRGRRIRITPLAAAVRSAVIPGWGQLVEGRGRVAVWMFRVVVVVLTAVAAAAVVGPSQLARWLVDPQVLLGLLVLNVALALFRLFAVWDAWQGAGGVARSGILFALLLFVAVPHVAVGWGQFRTYTVLTSVFGGDDADRVAAVGGTPTTGGVEPSATEGSEGTEPTPSTVTTLPTTTTTSVPWEGRERLNVLLLGGDAGPGRRGIRTDTMILVSIDLTDGDVALFGFPRNLKRLSFPDGSEFTAYSGILNEVYAFGLDRPDLFPGSNPGAAAIRTMIEGLSGIEIDYYVLVNLQAFVDVVDALGGVTMYIPETVVDPTYPKEDGTTVSIRIEAGVQHLSGTEALAYVRSRRQSSDYNRMGRQRCFLTALAAQVDVPSLLRGLPALLRTVEENVLTDIPIELLPDLIELAGDVDATDALVVGFGPPDWIVGRTSDRYPIPDVDKIREAVQLAITDPEAARIEYGLTAAAEACGFGEDPTTPPETTSTTSTTAPASTTTTPSSTTTTGG